MPKVSTGLRSGEQGSKGKTVMWGAPACGWRSGGRPDSRSVRHERQRRVAWGLLQEMLMLSVLREGEDLANVRPVSGDE